MSAAESAAESAAASAAKQNLKAKKNDFHHYIRHINVYGTYVRVKFIFSTPPPKKRRILKNFTVLVYTTS